MAREYSSTDYSVYIYTLPGEFSIQREFPLLHRNSACPGFLETQLGDSLLTDHSFVSFRENHVPNAA